MARLGNRLPRQTRVSKKHRFLTLFRIGFGFFLVAGVYIYISAINFQTIHQLDFITAKSALVFVKTAPAPRNAGERWHKTGSRIKRKDPIPDDGIRLRRNKNTRQAKSTKNTVSTKFTTAFNKTEAERVLKLFGPLMFHKPITAYLEPPLNDTVPNATGDRGDWTKKTDKGRPPTFLVPLPVRTWTPDDLVAVVYDRVQSCNDMPAKFPVDRGLQLDANGNTVVWNVGDQETSDDFARQELPYCPVDADPFLPWIHDMFPSQDGSRIEFVAQNKRRCRTGSKHTRSVHRLAPQVALMQPISVARIQRDADQQQQQHHHDYNAPRYRLAPRNESALDGMFTRFICRFHAVHYGGATNTTATIIVGETLSQYPFNYEQVAYRKLHTTLLTPRGKDSVLFWTSTLRFYCPVPADDDLRAMIAHGDFVLSDGTPTLHVDVIPIRTSPRYYEMYLTEELIGPMDEWNVAPFNAAARWGRNHILPPVEASGRWANLPICLPPLFKNEKGASKLIPDVSSKPIKPHYLSACLWASAEFKTRGLSKASATTSDTFLRLEEWIEFHLLAGFDHIYLYDNSGAHTNQSSLADMAANYPGRITRIDWPSIVCNNNIPAHDSAGERSSQYAAENSCRTRYGPFTEWIGSFDVDEYLVPMGNYTSLKHILHDASKHGTNILSFRSSRGKLVRDACDEIKGGLAKRANVTFLEAYNCDGAGSPRPTWAERARKQLYRADHVLNHFVHYATVTKALVTTYNETIARGEQYQRRHFEASPLERYTDEVNEAVMIHAKGVLHDQTTHYKQRCSKKFGRKWLGCSVGFPWATGRTNKDAKLGEEHDEDGVMYNCFINERVKNYWVPRLLEALQKKRSLAAR
jgi:hypothetical protein